jgi:tRNA G18 (ribose-2'-O)-methylase SpoU
MGSHFSLSWIGGKKISSLKNYVLIGADQNSKNKKLDKLIDKWALVMGSESRGISKTTRSYLDQTIGITKIGTGESLNIGVAMGILLHKMTK